MDGWVGGWMEVPALVKEMRSVVWVPTNTLTRLLLSRVTAKYVHTFNAIQLDSPFVDT